MKIDSIKISKTNLVGVDLICSKQWDGEILRMSRAVFDKNSSNPFLDRPGVYVIYADHYDKVKFGNEIYIGQGDDVRLRLNEHARTKPFWNKVLIFTSEKMNVAIAFNIEKDFIQKAKMANKYTVKNGDNGQSKKLGREDVSYKDAYIEYALLVLTLAGLDIFSTNFDGMYTKNNYLESADIKLAEGDCNKVIMLEGSKLLKPRNESVIEDENIKSVITVDDTSIIFNRDCILDVEPGYSPSVLKGNINLSQFVNSSGVKLSTALKKHS